ncbi:DMT family transporter, partial [Roseobacter sinensis]
ARRSLHRKSAASSIKPDAPDTLLNQAAICPKIPDDGYFAALTYLTLAEALLITQLSLMLMAVCAVILLSERLTIWRNAGVLIGFGGVVVLVWPELGNGTQNGARLWGVGLALVSAVLLP